MTLETHAYHWFFAGLFAALGVVALVTPPLLYTHPAVLQAFAHPQRF